MTPERLAEFLSAQRRVSPDRWGGLEPSNAGEMQALLRSFRQAVLDDIRAEAAAMTELGRAALVSLWQVEVRGSEAAKALTAAAKEVVRDGGAQQLRARGGGQLQRL